MTDASATLDVVRSQIADPSTGWSLGTFGAIAEFTRAPDEAADVSAAEMPLSATTSRGDVRIGNIDGVRLFASESVTRESWNHRIALCLPAQSYPRETVIAEKFQAMVVLGLANSRLKDFYDAGLQVRRRCAARARSRRPSRAARPRFLSRGPTH
jgi:hypothetical protein